MRRGKSGSDVREGGKATPRSDPWSNTPHLVNRRISGETEADFESLLDFVEETEFERLGVFKYSEERARRQRASMAKLTRKRKSAVGKK
jgi:hypothetical protein